jgi:Uma2 family endonuclease
VDNELQNLIPGLLRAILSHIWSARQDWFFGVNMGVYHATGENPRIPIVPDGFLSLEVPRRVEPYGRKSYIVWLENNIPPRLVLECVSESYGGEYDEKMQIYGKLGVLYYAIYNPQFNRRDRHKVLEVYQLSERQYIRLPGEPIWMPEIGLGIGREIGTFENWQREWLYWYDEQGNRYLTPEEIAQRERQRAETERQRADRLAQLLRERGLDPDSLSE